MQRHGGNGVCGTALQCRDGAPCEDGGAGERCDKVTFQRGLQPRPRPTCSSPVLPLSSHHQMESNPVPLNRGSLACNQGEVMEVTLSVFCG